jgi:hypothetical protein
MKKKYILSICSITLLCIGCVKLGQERQEHEIIKVNLDKIFNRLDLSFCFDSIYTHTLITPEDEVIGIISKILFHEGHVFLLSEKQKKIYIFNEHGKYVNKIDNIGPGPREYSSITNFFLKDGLIGIIDDRQSMVTFYRLNGDFVNKMSYKNIFRDIIPYDDSTYLCYTPDFMEKNPYGIWIMDNNGHYKRDIAKPQEKASHSINTPWFNMVKKENNEFIIYDTSRNKIITVKNDSVSVEYEFNPNRKTLVSFPNVKDKRNIHDEYYEIIHVIDADNWIYSTWANIKTFEMTHALYQKKEKETHSFNELNLENSIKEYGYPVFSNRANSLVYITHGDELSNLSEKEELNNLYIHEFIFN